MRDMPARFSGAHAVARDKVVVTDNDAIRPEGIVFGARHDAIMLSAAGTPGPDEPVRLR
jgi:hypothetical protein